MKELEFDKFLSLVARNAQTEKGKATMGRVRPMARKEAIIKEQALVSEMVKWIDTHGLFSFSDIADPDLYLNRLAIEGTVLDVQGILVLMQMMTAGEEIRRALSKQKEDFPLLSAEAGKIPPGRDLLKQLAGKFLSPDQVTDQASEDLSAIRKRRKKTENAVTARLQRMLADPAVARYLQDSFVAVRNKRFVLPVRSDALPRVKGVMHGSSSSGVTFYVEPFETVPLNNLATRLEEEERMEVARILSRYSDLLREHLDALQYIDQAITRFDTLQAKGDYSRRHFCIEPQIRDERHLVLRKAWHPVLKVALEESGSEPVPISIEIHPDSHILVISGPNAGGKTVALKTIGLLTLMAQAGFHIPAVDAEIPCFSKILTDIGDSQSIDANLSTFTGHLHNIIRMIKECDSETLLLLDELGTGTDPEEGAALGIALLEFFRRKGIYLAVTTHHNRIKTYAFTTDGMANAAVEFDQATLQPTFNITMGVAGNSSGLSIAGKLGMDADILGMAENLLSPEEAEARRFLSEIGKMYGDIATERDLVRQEKDTLRKARENLEKQFERREKIRIENFEKRLEEVLDAIKVRGEDLLSTVKEEKEIKRLEKKLGKRMQQLKRKTAEMSRGYAESLGASGRPSPALFTPLQVGDRVHVSRFHCDGRVEHVGENGEITVAAGDLKIAVARGDCEKIEPAAGEEHQTPLYTLSDNISVTAPSSEEVGRELKVIGHTVAEALEKIDKFLDSAFLANYPSVSIIHGHGSGKLRKEIGVFLRDHPHVSKFHCSSEQAGGRGITVVELG